VPLTEPLVSIYWDEYSSNLGLVSNKKWLWKRVIYWWSILDEVGAYLSLTKWDLDTKIAPFGAIGLLLY